MAKDKSFFPFAARVHPRYGVPGRSILLQGIIALVLVLIGSFEQIVIYLEFALLIFPPFAIAGLFIARKKQVGEQLAAKTWGFPIVPLFFLITNLAIMVVAYINRPVESTAAIVTILLGIPLYFLFSRQIKENR